MEFCMSRAARVKVVSAFVPIPKHPRPASEYQRRGVELQNALAGRPLHVFNDELADLWMASFLERLNSGPVQHQQGDNPAKNTLNYHMVQHNKLEWLERATFLDSDAETFVWLDYGIMTLPGFSTSPLTAFLDRIVVNDLAIPGCWERRLVNTTYPCWRFCGSLLCVPRDDVFPLNRAFKAMTRAYVQAQRDVTWEVNMLAMVDLLNLGPAIRWYLADHNARMLTGY
jgi:hypothetical protein